MDYAEAMKWYRRAAEQGHKQAKMVLPSLEDHVASQKKTEQVKADMKLKFDKMGTECDKLAADPLDPGKIAVGVFWNKLDADSAIKACGQAVEAEPDSARLQFQYGRSLHKKKQYADAMKWYHKAAEQGYAIAEVNLRLVKVAKQRHEVKQKKRIAKTRIWA